MRLTGSEREIQTRIDILRKRERKKQKKSESKIKSGDEVESLRENDILEKVGFLYLIQVVLLL